MSKFFKNFILCGNADHHCLLCQETFKSTVEIEKHIRWEKHRKSMKTQAYSPKFKKDAIYKIGNYFYCEICNYTTKDIAVLAIHINEDKHKTNKNNPESVIKKVIGQYDSGFVVLDNMIIENNQWQGIIGVKCVLCNTIIHDYAKHMALPDHVINLIQTEIKCDDGHYYRLINKDNFQCFTCKSTFSTKLFKEHWSNDRHVENMGELEIKQTNKGDKDRTKETKDNIKNNVVGNVVEKLSTEAKKMIVDTQKKFFDFDMENITASCKVCKEIVQFELKAILGHMKIHTDIKITEGDLDNEHKAITSEDENEVIFRETQDHGKRRSELSTYGKDNLIRLNAGGSKGYCTLCDKELSAHIKVFKQHVKGTSHSGHLELKGLKQRTEHKIREYITIPLNSYIKNVIHAKEIEAFWINEEFTVDNDSFMLLKRIEHGLHYRKVKCYACDEICPPGTEYCHCKTMQHKKKFMNIKVFASEEEFIREIQPNLYHCGFCNEVFPFAETLEKHMKAWKHLLNKKQRQYEYFTIIYHYDELKLGKNNDILYMQCMNAVFGKNELL